MKLENVKDAKGFTLIEMMIVVAIIGILAAIGIPQYQQYVMKGNRAATQSFMMDVANRQKQYLLDARAYAPDLATLGMGTLPSEVSKHYTVTMNVPGGTPPTFVVTATPIPNKPQAADGALTLNDVGAKTPPDKW